MTQFKCERCKQFKPVKNQKQVIETIEPKINLWKADDPRYKCRKFMVCEGCSK